ncbi:unnamed protein product [Arabidopsis halleri]
MEIDFYGGWQLPWLAALRLMMYRTIRYWRTYHFLSTIHPQSNGIHNNSNQVKHPPLENDLPNPQYH